MNERFTDTIKINFKLLYPTTIPITIKIQCICSASIINDYQIVNSNNPNQINFNIGDSIQQLFIILNADTISEFEESVTIVNAGNMNCNNFFSPFSFSIYERIYNATVI